MGFKRSFEAEYVQELNVKHAKLDGGVIGYDLSDLYGFETGLCEEDAQSGETTQSCLSHESPETDFSWKPVSRRKPVPIGRDYQADIPECVKEVTGKCVIPMPDYETEFCGKGREECVCFDKGSIRCVQKHIMESREDLFETIGYETCLNIGLYEMGEELAAGKLTEDEEDLFHEIVYSNPDRDFWKQLKSAFPTRTTKEIVSYYFNVFVLRRRAVQNRSRNLDIDSDDDEWQVEYDELTGKGLSRDEEEDSCMSYDYWRHCDDLVDHSYSFDDPCDSILLDHCWTKNIDFFPTSNIIDEIFGQE